MSPPPRERPFEGVVLTLSFFVEVRDFASGGGHTEFVKGVLSYIFESMQQETDGALVG